MPVAFPFPCNWQQPYQERRSFRTDIIVARDLTEQRRLLQGRAVREYRFSVQTDDEREVGWLESLLYQGMNDTFAVPYWPHSSFLTAPAAIGAGSISCETTFRDFWEDGYALLLAGPYHWELVQVQTVGAGSLTLVGVTGNAWPIGTLIVPAHIADLMPDTQLQHVGGRAAIDAELRFTVRDPAMPAQFGVHDDPIPTMMVTGMPDGGEEASDLWLRAARELRPIAGPPLRFPMRDQPTTTWEHPLKLLSLAEADELWSWFHDVTGRWRPSWVPDFHRPLRLAQDLAAASTTMVILWSGYTTYQFPHVARRWLALCPAPGVVVRRLVTDSVDNGTTETLTLASAFGHDVGRDDEIPLLCRARYARMEQDAVQLDWVAPGLAQVALSLIDLPFETPVS